MTAIACTTCNGERIVRTGVEYDAATGQWVYDDAVPCPDCQDRPLGAPAHQVIAAAEAVVTMQFASVTFLHRRFKFGYDTAGVLLDALERLGVVGPAGTSHARDVLIKPEGLTAVVARIEAAA